MALEIQQQDAVQNSTPDELAGLTDEQKKMVELGRTVRTTDPDSTPAQPVVEEAPKFPKPDGIPEEFFDVATGKVDYEGLTKSYLELKGKLEAPTETKAPEGEQQAEPQADGLAKFSAEFAEKGALSEDSYKELEAKGISKEMVDTYIEAIKTKAEVGEAQVLASVGGREAFNVMSQWAAVNLTQKELDAFNAQVSSSADAAGIAVTWLKAKYEAANGKAPKLVSGHAAPSGPVGFATRSEMFAAISDKRYGRDPEYTALVERKVAARQFGSLSS